MAAVVLLFLPGAGLAQGKRVLRVPADFPKVQAAIDSARSGDTVLVAPGRYYENLQFRGQNIVLASEFVRSRDRSAIERTILDGSRPAHPDSGAVVTIWRYEDSTAVVEGFTITGGTGTVWFDNKDKINFREGGGIIVDLAGPTIRNNIIEGNVAVDKGTMLSAGGGGIRVGFAEPIIEQNVIRNNKGRYGGGIVLFHSAATVRNNVIAGNEGGQDFGGAGIWVVGYYSQKLTNLIEHNTIAGNVGRVDSTLPEGRRRISGKGAGLHFGFSRAIIRDNIIWGNTPDQVQNWGESPPVITASVVQGGYQGTGNIDLDPQFADMTYFALKPGSPAKNRGARVK
jgi:hypothetical protein